MKQLNFLPTTADSKINNHHGLSFMLNDETMNEMNAIVKNFIVDRKPFLQHRYSLRDMAENTNIRLHHLSAFINKYYGMNFNDFINEYRVEHCKSKIMNDEWISKKLEAIAMESGFNNRNSFSIAFKKATGQNPSDFLRTKKNISAEM